MAQPAGTLPFRSPTPPCITFVGAPSAGLLPSGASRTPPTSRSVLSLQLRPRLEAHLLRLTVLLWFLRILRFSEQSALAVRTSIPAILMQDSWLRATMELRAHC